METNVIHFFLVTFTVECFSPWLFHLSRPHGCSKVGMPVAFGSPPLGTVVTGELLIVDDIASSNAAFSPNPEVT